LRTAKIEIFSNGTSFWLLILRIKNTWFSFRINWLSIQ